MSPSRNGPEQLDHLLAPQDLVAPEIAAAEAIRGHVVDVGDL